ncbi:peptidase U32 family protein [Pelagicoccus sp. SDUM812002]|uniref:peptidase U32 family protein n=1 Tax=Pelagicoccus sp. SDUM812002 TaxID=3041266 RepID=UPI00280D1FA6|nr:peptidase U32 family protein [Pelagicoccus sp. SDUM812002]MDQ8185904.1 U32 family peptidase [Pelagicoccus sp. SDUM812002]
MSATSTAPETTSTQASSTASEHVEILAPAGCYASLQAAIDSGADSVYFGLAQLNMRARSRRSFHLKDLEEIMIRCHAAGIRGYLTLNTLLYDHDLKLCFALLEEAAKQKVDAVIASDMACILKGRELGLEVHLSTQFSVSNYQSFKFYAQFCDRIVLARELNLSMIRKIRQQVIADDLRGPSGRPVEIEAFAHGALCIAVSGRCGMSLYTDNASANRGACTQNCRKEYKVVDQQSGKELLIDNNFVMSPNDICTIDFLDKVLEAGVHTLKLEGRGRSPEYVSTVTEVYRQAVDAIQEETYNPELVATLNDDLKKVYHRGHSSGYYLGREQGWSMTHGTKATRQKGQAGRVTHYYNKLGVAEITASGTVKEGQEYLIIGETTGVVKGTTEALRLDNSTTVESVTNGQVFSIQVPAKVRLNDKFFLHLPTTQ